MDQRTCPSCEVSFSSPVATKNVLLGEVQAAREGQAPRPAMVEPEDHALLRLRKADGRQADFRSAGQAHVSALPPRPT